MTRYLDFVGRTRARVSYWCLLHDGEHGCKRRRRQTTFGLGMTTVPHSGLHLTSRCDLPARERLDWWVVVITICITADSARRKRETCSCMESGSILTTEAHCKSIYWHVARMTYDFCYSREKNEYILVGINTLQITINVRNGRYVLASPNSLIWRMLCGGPGGFEVVRSGKD